MSVGFGIFKDFLEADTLLLLSTPNGFDELANQLEVADLSSLRPIELSNWGWNSPCNVTATLVGASSGSRVNVSGDGRHVMWQLAETERRAVINKLRAMAVNARPGHQFLETEGDYQIIASHGEYPESILDDSPSSGLG